MDLVIMLPHLPRAGETVLGDRLGRHPGGKGANQAVAAARLGGQVGMVGRVGADDFGAELVANLAANGVDASGVERDNSAATGAALIFVGPEGQNMIAVAPGANGRLDTFDIERAVARLQSGDVLVMQLEIPMAVITPAAEAARRAGARVLLNAAPAQPLDPGLLDQVDALVVNEGEARAIVDKASPEAAAAALHAIGPRIAAVTRRPAGSVFCDDTGAPRA